MDKQSPISRTKKHLFQFFLLNDHATLDKKSNTDLQKPLPAAKIRRLFDWTTTKHWLLITKQMITEVRRKKGANQPSSNTNEASSKYLKSMTYLEKIKKNYMLWSRGQYPSNILQEIFFFPYPPCFVENYHFFTILFGKRPTWNRCPLNPSQSSSFLCFPKSSFFLFHLS